MPKFFTWQLWIGRNINLFIICNHAVWFFILALWPQYVTDSHSWESHNFKCDRSWVSLQTKCKQWGKGTRWILSQILLLPGRNQSKRSTHICSILQEDIYTSKLRARTHLAKFLLDNFTSSFCDLIGCVPYIPPHLFCGNTVNEVLHNIAFVYEFVSFCCH